MKHKRPGFTLVELLIAIVVIAILAAIAIVTYNGIQERAYASKAGSAMRQAHKLIQLYAAEHSQLPDSSCIGRSSDYVAKPPFEAGNCTVGTDPGNLTVKTDHYGPVYDSAVNTALGSGNIDVQWPEVAEVYSSYALVHRGVYWARNSAGSGVVGVIMKGEVSCPDGSSSTYQAEPDVTICRSWVRI